MNAIQCDARRCNAMQCNAMLMQCNAMLMQCNVMSCNGKGSPWAIAPLKREISDSVLFRVQREEKRSPSLWQLCSLFQLLPEYCRPGSFTPRTVLHGPREMKREMKGTGNSRSTTRQNGRGAKMVPRGGKKSDLTKGGEATTSHIAHC